LEEKVGFKCSICGFELWKPIIELRTGNLGLYNDARFPGRSLFVLKDHFDEFSRLPDDLACDFILEARVAGRAIQRATQSPRVNYAILGNAEPHVHMHLIPRFPKEESLPTKSPWTDPRPKSPLTEKEVDDLIVKIRRELEILQQNPLTGIRS
jgi:diadenosine tetraphosphate (Ap4A) HIT family hydrolase